MNYLLLFSSYVEIHHIQMNLSNQIEEKSLQDLIEMSAY